MQRYCFALDLKEDETLIREYLYIMKRYGPKSWTALPDPGSPKWKFTGYPIACS